MLEVLGGFDVGSRLGEGSEKRGRTDNKAVKKRGVCRVREWPEMRGKWRHSSVSVVFIDLCA